MPLFSSTTLTPTQEVAVAWTFVGTGTLMSIARYYFRLKMHRRLFWDDFWHAMAVIANLTHLGLVTGFLWLVYDMLAFQVRKGKPPVPNVYLFEQLDLTTAQLAQVTYWSVKISFLCLYRQLFKVSRRFNIAWWSVMAFTILTYWVCFAMVWLSCGGDGSHRLDFKFCSTTSATNAARRGFTIRYVMNVSSDLAIMILPITMLRDLQMPIRQKLGICLIFCLTFVIIAFESLRLAMSLQGGAQTFNLLWGHLEIAVAVMVSCLPSFMAAVNFRRRLKDSQYATSQQYGHMVHSKVSSGRTATSGSGTHDTDSSSHEGSFNKTPRYGQHDRSDESVEMQRRY